MSRLAPLALASLALTAGIGGAFAQAVDPGIDLAAIRERATRATDEADALAAAARQRAKAVRDEAAASADQGQANGSRFASEAKRAAPANNATFDFDAMVSSAGTMAREGLGEAPRFIAFASLSMPPEALKAILADVPRAGGVVVFRGLTKGSAKAMTEGLTRVLSPGEKLDGVGIDPRLFRAFGIEAVPTYVVASSDFDLCSGFDCATPLPPFDKLSGNVTTRYALETIASGGGPGAKIAAQHLARLESTQP